MKTFKQMIIFVFVLLATSGCSLKLSDKKEKFSANGLAYEFQLPSTWKRQKDFKQVYNNAAIFGAEDENSGSYMFILAQSKELFKDKEFAKKTREKLQKSYNYKKAEDIYLKEYTINELPALKYTFLTTFSEEDVWAHLYYVETENAILQIVFYSADDQSYKDRVKIIDKSVESVKETGKDSKTSGNTTETEDNNQNTVIENSDMKIMINGYRPTTDKQGNEYVAIRYNFMNLKETPVTSDLWYPLVTATQNNQVLEQVSQLETDSEEMLNLQKMTQEKLEKNQSVEGVLFYKLVNQSKEDVTLSFSKEHFSKQTDISLAIGGFKENE